MQFRKQNNKRTPLYPREQLKRKVRKIFFHNFFQMAKKDFLTNYKLLYNINEKDEKLCLLVQINERDYYIYKRICNLVLNSFVVSSEKWFDVDIDAEQNERLLKHFTTKLFRKFLRSRREEKEVGHGCELEKLYITMRVFKWRKIIFFRWKKNLQMHLKKCFDYITRPCSRKDITFWKEYSLFCLPFKIYDHVEKNTFQYCTCEPFLYKKYCYDPNHQRIPNCCNCKIDGDCSRLPGHCDACAFRHNLAEICGQLTEKKTILTIFTIH